MTSKELRRLITTAIATGSISAASAYGINKPNCDYVMFHEEQEICISEEVKNIIESQTPVSQGFGGIKFGGAE